MKIILIVIPTFFAFLFTDKAIATDAIPDYSELSIEQLMDVEVTSVSKHAQSLSDSAAAIFVISQNDIKKTGVTSIPEALRMAPGIHVARIDAQKWAISSRGFNDLYANKLLVLIDGRSIYSPTFSGVVWDVHDLLLEDVDRIEVIRGPGATLWGSNAVNGIINIITKKAEDTESLITFGGGTEEKAFVGGRLRTQVSDATDARFSIKAFERDDFEHSTLDSSEDGWKKILGTFRIDSQFSGNDNLMVSGGYTKNKNSSRVSLPRLLPPDYTEVLSGKDHKTNAYILSKWSHQLSPQSEFSFQAFYDYSRMKQFVWDETRNTVDLDFNHNFQIGERQKLIWGLGYRYTHDTNYPVSGVFSQTPERRADNLFNAFIQDKFSLIDEKLWLTLGSKFEYNEYSGFEVQPSARLFWAPSKEHKMWAAISRAVRTPSRFEHDITVLNVRKPVPTFPYPIQVIFTGTENFKSEDLLAYELGYRFIPSNNFSIDVTAFYNRYTNLSSVENSAPEFNGTYLSIHTTLGNIEKRNSYGLELATAWHINDRWLLNLAYSYFNDSKKNLTTSVAEEPTNKLSLRSDWAIRDDLDFNLWLRFVDESVSRNNVVTDTLITIDSYITLDTRLAWRAKENLELSLVGQNLFDSSHPEYTNSGYDIPTVEIQRGFFAKVSLSF